MCGGRGEGGGGVGASSDVDICIACRVYLLTLTITQSGIDAPVAWAQSCSAAITMWIAGLRIHIKRSSQLAMPTALQNLFAVADYPPAASILRLLPVHLLDTALKGRGAFSRLVVMAPK